MHVNILNYAGRRYLWWSLLIMAASIAVYFSQSPDLPRSGGSWQGYTLGGLGVLLILWLAWLGIRKRSYRSNAGSLQQWVSAHVYLGLTLPVVVTLHCAFQFGINVHTLAYTLLAGVFLSGLYGLYSYLRFPTLLMENRAEQPMEARLEELERIDKAGLETAEQCDENVNAAVKSALARTAIGGGFWDQLRARDRSRVLLSEQSKRQVRNPDQQTIIDYLVPKIPDTSKRGEAERLRELLYVFGRRAEILQRIRRELSLQLRLKLWLCFHIPLTVGLLVALIAHVFSVFFYW